MKMNGPDKTRLAAEICQKIFAIAHKERSTIQHEADVESGRLVAYSGLRSRFSRSSRYVQELSLNFMHTLSLWEIKIRIKAD